MKRLVWLAAALLLSTVPAQADPLSIGVAVLVNIGWAGTISAGLATAIGIGVLAAGAIGVSLLAGALTPGVQQPKPSERQTTIRQAVGARVRFYGRVKVGGTLWFFDTAAGALYVGITLNEGEISAIVETWLNDAEVTIDSGTNWVTAPDQYLINGDTDPVARIYYKLGTDTQTVHAALDSAFASVNAAHRLRGVANVLAVFLEVDSEAIAEVYPQYVPQLRAVIDASLVKSVRTTGAVIFSDNAADVIYDYLTAVDGAGFPYGAGYRESQIDLASFQAFADLSDQAVALKAGGTVARYKLAGGYGLNERIRDVLPRLLRACDAALYMTAEGKLAIRGGEWIEPVLTLDDGLGHIISAEFRMGQSALAAFNELTVTYTEPTLDYQEAEAQVWQDTDNIALRGRVLPAQLDVLWAPNHSQARRLAKIHTKKSNPRWAGTVITNYYGMNAVGEATVNVKFSPLGIDESFAINRIEFLPDGSGVKLDISSLGPEAYEWDAATEEGEGPSVPPDTTDSVVTGPVTTLVATPGTGTLGLTWVQPSNANVSGARVYRNTINDFTTAVRQSTVYGGALVALAYNEVVPAGSYYYWVVAINGSGLEATEVASGLVTIT